MNMKNITKSAILFSVAILLVLSIVGCDEEQQLPSSKKTRLIVNENMNLKEQLHDRDTQIQTLQAKLQTQKNLLEKCQKENNSLKMQKQKDSEAFMMKILMSADTEKQDLKNQIKTLKEKIKELEAK